MKLGKLCSAHKVKPAGPARSAAIAELVQNEFERAPLIGEQAANACIKYLDQCSRQECATRLWLRAEAEVMAERNPFVFTCS